MNRLWKITYGEKERVYGTDFVLAPDIKTAISKVETEIKEIFPMCEILSAKLFAHEVLS